MSVNHATRRPSTAAPRTHQASTVRFVPATATAQALARSNVAAGRLPDSGRQMPVAVPAPWEANAVDLARLDKTDPASRRRLNNAWRALKHDAPDEAAQLGDLYGALRQRFPGAGFLVPADTLDEPADEGDA